jgi:hypothetical protein
MPEENLIISSQENLIISSQTVRHPGIWIMHEVREEKVEENTKMRVFRLQKI